jgi:hypothetical protein
VAKNAYFSLPGRVGMTEPVRLSAPLVAKAPGIFGLRASLGGILLPLAAFAVQWTFWDAISPYAWFLFYPTVFFAPLFGGLWSGIVATVISTLLVWYVFILTAFFHYRGPCFRGFDRAACIDGPLLFSRTLRSSV